MAESEEDEMRICFGIRYVCIRRHAVKKMMDMYEAIGVSLEWDRLIFVYPGDTCIMIFLSGVAIDILSSFYLEGLRVFVSILPAECGPSST